jgi:hypothetical protein
MLFSETQRQWRAPSNYHNSMKRLHKVKNNVKKENKIINFKELTVKKINKSPKIPNMHFKTIQM